jgi:outer membrane biosynthesis protein TonB
MWFRPLIAAALGALALTGCGSENDALIPQQDADQLTALVSEAGDASAAGECDRARQAVEEAELQLSGLPRRTDKRLKANLRDWLQYLDRKIADECEEPQPDETPTPEPTPEPTETPTPTATPEPTETPTPTPTPEPTVTVDPGTGGEGSPEEPQGTGGVPPGDNDG